MRQPPNWKPVIWVGSSRNDLREFPENAQDKIGTALQKVQYGSRSASVKTLSGFGGASVLEIKVSDDGDAYRAVYTVKFAEYIFVLHAYQKKSSHGIQTAKQDVDMIQARLKLAETTYQEMIAHQNQER
ncbi:MAG: type II toxin-antitoxin system RelE/ParE family toxin [Armatimonadota bacterium]|nr:type II toxin-antitoxin system RelE/ParE family toxin [Armatimonadota bacterium]